MTDDSLRAGVERLIEVAENTSSFMALIEWDQDSTERDAADLRIELNEASSELRALLAKHPPTPPTEASARGAAKQLARYAALTYRQGTDDAHQEIVAEAIYAQMTAPPSAPSPVEQEKP